MKRLSHLFLIFLLSLSACDDGNIYPKETENPTGKKVTLSTRFIGINAWPEAYQLALAGFGSNKATPVISKIISAPTNENQTLSLTLSGVTNDVTSVSVCIMTTGRSLIHSFYTLNIADSTKNEITLPVKEIDVAAFGRIQNQIFNLYCSRCHGAGNSAAAGMYLTQSKSYDMLVNHIAAKSLTGKLRVKPGLVGSSFIHDVLTTDIIGYNHTDVLPEKELINLIDTWIESGAKNN